MIQEIREPQIRIHDIWIQIEEILPHRTQSRILVAERRDEYRWVAVVIEFVVYAPLWKDRSLVLAQRGAHLIRQTVLQHETRAHVRAVG